MLERVIKTVKSVLDIDEEAVLTADMGPDDIDEWDSFGLIALFAAIEKEYQVKFSYEEMIQIGCIGDIVTILEQKELA